MMRKATGLCTLLLFAGCPTDPSTDGGSDAGQRCVTLSDCPQGGVCEQVLCTAGFCSRNFLAAGTPAGVQANGDCKKTACDGMGLSAVTFDDADIPSDSNECTLDACAQGVARHTVLDAGTPCGTGHTLACMGGVCAGCGQPSDCSAATECQSPTCVNAICGTSNRAQGTRLSTQVAGDCKAVQCNGQGASETVNDNLDVPADATACTTDSCDQGQPQHVPVQVGTVCNEDGGTLCDSSGACRACLVASDCSGTDTECHARTCTAGVCGVRNTDAGTAVASQSAGDCQKNVCNGAGAVTGVADNVDLADDNNACSANACDAGAPWFPPLDAGTACGAAVCNATGQCVGCNLPSDCGSSDACKTRTCDAGLCGLVLTQPGTEVANASATDCLHDVCSAQGSIVPDPLDSETPADDGNPCTTDVCSAGQPSHPGVPTNTACDGGVCSSTAVCVECNAPSQCPGADAECRGRSCLSNVCGFALADAGIVTAAQTPGDCKQNRCDGDGGVVAATFDSDAPLDDGQQCTGEVCINGAPNHPFADPDTACTESSGMYCDGAGACVQCNRGDQCASMICHPTNHTCNPPSCVDGVKNGTETDTDCGGTCPKCGPGKGCLVHGDCNGGACHPTSHVCAPTCTSGSGAGQTCASYCACMTPTCSATFGTTPACIAACASFDETQICCRGYHCQNAIGDPVGHCPHAAGLNTCP